MKYEQIKQYDDEPDEVILTDIRFLITFLKTRTLNTVERRLLNNCYDIIGTVQLLQDGVQ